MEVGSIDAMMNEGFGASGAQARREDISPHISFHFHPTAADSLLPYWLVVLALTALLRYSGVEAWGLRPRLHRFERSRCF